MLNILRARKRFVRERKRLQDNAKHSWYCEGTKAYVNLMLMFIFFRYTQLYLYSAFFYFHCYKAMKYTFITFILIL